RRTGRSRRARAARLAVRTIGAVLTLRPSWASRALRAARKLARLEVLLEQRLVLDLLGRDRVLLQLLGADAVRVDLGHRVGGSSEDDEDGDRRHDVGVRQARTQA